MNIDLRCPNCGSTLPPDVPVGLCARCLLETAATTLTGGGFGGAASRSLSRPLPGEDFGGYHIRRLLGKGGMGEVWEAEQTESGRRVALKVMRHALVSDDDRKRFLREGRLAASVSHPNVVYVYGSEEIGGAPAIAMELAREGTLKDLVARRGPLPVAEAVDLILQVMAGLEAAKEAGVLHRDIKPGNCFLGEDGVVKIGDFGLSISTLALGESMLTAGGVVHGTPSFASPEQLRGEDLDVRSDIYSVGATLYFLVTGHAPIEGNDLVKLIAAVLDQAPVPPRERRSDLPTAFARILLRCLSKHRSDRFGGYAELARALSPFGSAAPNPALLGRRLLSGVLDEVVAGLPAIALVSSTGMLVDERFLVERDWLSGLLLGGCFAVSVLYYGICESRWGAGFGKWICGLRVTVPGSGGAGFGLALLRAVVFKSGWMVRILVGLLAYSAAEATAAMGRAELLVSDWVELGALVVLFLTARRGNGFAGLHDLASGTRVVDVSGKEGRPEIVGGGQVEIPTSLPERVGAYGVVGPISQLGDGSRIDLGYDEVLRRTVWLRRVPDDHSPVPEGRRDLNRGSRLRWLNGARGAGDAWDAYEAPDGQCFLEVVKTAQSWSAVRYWLADLADEFHAGMARGVPASTFAFDRIWITRNGRALLLDFPAPGAEEEPGAMEVIAGGSLVAHQRFLSAVAAKALGPGTSGGCSGGPPSLAARSFLARLGEGGFESIEVLRGNLRSLVDRPATPSALLRTVTILLPAVAAAFFATLIAFATQREVRKWDAAWNETYPGTASLADVLRRVEEQWSVAALADEEEGRPPAAEASRNLFHLQVYAGAEFGDILADDAFWRHPDLGRSLDDARRGFLTTAREIGKLATPEEVAAARAAARSLLGAEPSAGGIGIAVEAAATALAGILLSFALLALLVTLILGQPLGLRLAGLVVVDGRGRPASRGRLIFRWLLGWLPTVVVVAVLALLLGGDAIGGSRVSLGRWLGMLAGLPGLLALRQLVAKPWRGWHDVLSRTAVTLR